MPEDDSDFIDEIVGDKLPTHTQRPLDCFLPWHRVRKEFVRRHQWNELTLRLIKRRWHKELRQPEIEWSMELDPDDVPTSSVSVTDAQKMPLKCLLIPGDDLLDVRALWRDTADHNIHIRYLGFNESNGSDQIGTRVHVANNAVTSLDRMATDSQVIRDRFEAIANSKSQAKRYLRQYGPYHVVNLDFCGSLFPNSQRETRPYHNAIRELLAYQFAEQRCEWLLFITTEVQPSIADHSGLHGFVKLTRDNFDQYPEFGEALSTVLPRDAFQDESVPVILGDLSEDQMISLFGISLGKWLLHLSHEAQPQWTIAMRRSYQYSINTDSGAVMLALAFEFSPNIKPPMDQTGISDRTAAVRDFPDEETCAIRLARGVAAIEDIDKRLVSDQALKRKLAESQADLLQSAGYDRDAYLTWVENGEGTQ